MKRARQVEVDEPVSYDDHKELLKHARNSSEWYCNAGMKTESMIRDKLVEKGYPNRSVRLDTDESVNYIEEALEYCRSLYIIYTDEAYCEEIARDGVRQGKGPLELRQKFMLKGIDSEAVKECLEDYPVADAIENGMRKAMRTQGVRKAENAYQAKQKLIEYFARKGFRFGDIQEAIEDIDLED